MADNESSGNIVEKEDFGTGEDGANSRWEAELEESRKEAEQRKFYDNGRKALNVFMSAPIGDNEATSPRYNVYHRYGKVVAKTIYARSPKTKVVARPGFSGPEVKRACDILERSCDHYTQDPDSNFYKETGRAVFDYVHVARGAVFPRYEVDEDAPTRVAFDGSTPPPEGAQVLKDKQGQYYLKPNIRDERIVFEYVNWTDYRESVSKLTREIRWRAKRTFVTKDTAKKKWGAIKDKNGKPITDSLQYTSKYTSSTDGTEGSEDGRHQIYQRAEIWEIHSKEDLKQIFFSPGYGVIEEIEDPWGLLDFWPEPAPLLGTITNDSTIPVNDYKVFGYLVDQINELTLRMGWITQAIKVVAAYDAKLVTLKDIFTAMDTSYVPVDDWQAFAESKGFEGILAFTPIQPYIDGIVALRDQRASLIQDFNENSGYSEIVQPDASGKTEGEKQRSADAPKVSLQEKQEEVQRFLRDLIAIVAEILSKKFEGDRLLVLSGFKLTEEEQQLLQMPPPQETPAPVGALDENGQPVPPTPPDPKLVEAWQAAQEKERLNVAALALLKSDTERPVAVTLQTDSTIAVNERMEKRDRIEVTNMTSQFFAQLGTLAQSAPEFVPAAIEQFLFVLDAFSVARPIEETIKAGLEAWKKRLAAPPPPPPPDPMQIRTQADIQIAQIKAASDEKVSTFETQMKQIIAQQSDQMKAMDIQMKGAIEQQKAQMAAQAEQVKFAHSSQIELLQAKLDATVAATDGQIQREKIAMDAQLKFMQQQFDMKLETMRMNAELGKSKLDASMKLVEAHQKHQEMIAQREERARDKEEKAKEKATPAAAPAPVINVHLPENKPTKKVTKVKRHPKTGDIESTETMEVPEEAESE